MKNLQPAGAGIHHTRTGRIKTRVFNKQTAAVPAVLGILALLTMFAFVTMSYGKVSFFTALGQASKDFLTMMLQPGLAGHFTLADVITGLFVSLALAVITTFAGALIAFVLGLLASVNLSNKALSNTIKAFMSFFRAVPTILWVLVFSVAIGAVAGAGGIGYQLFLAGSFYYNIHEVGLIVYLCLAVAIVLEVVSSTLRKRYIIHS